MDIAYIVPFSFQFGKRVITAFRRIDLAVPDCVKFTFGGSIAFLVAVIDLRIDSDRLLLRSLALFVG